MVFKNVYQFGVKVLVRVEVQNLMTFGPTVLFVK